jgi:hypothetical protein
VSPYPSRFEVSRSASIKKVKPDFDDWVEKPMLNCPNVPTPVE